MTDQFETVLDDTIQSFIDDPVYLVKSQTAEGESQYLINKRYNYRITIRDILELTSGKQPSGVNILEIGPFLGVMSLTLAKLGYNVTAMDIPEYMDNEKLCARYEAEGVRYKGVNLCRYDIPFEDQEFDLIICCQVLEHLNFNPVPVVAEMNRILKQGGLLYLAVPNLTRYANRRNMIFGGSIHYPIEKFFMQLGPSLSSIVGIHWREYNVAETRELLSRLGFVIERQYLFDVLDFTENSKLSWKQRLVKRFIQWKQNWKAYQTTIGRKIRDNDIEFYFTDATKPCS